MMWYYNWNLGGVQKVVLPTVYRGECSGQIALTYAIGIFCEHVKDFSEFMFQIFDLSEKEIFNWFRDRWKSWAKQELHQQGITELTVAMFKVESFVKLGPRKHKFKSSKPKQTCNDERDCGEEGQVKNENGGNCKNDNNWKLHKRKCKLQKKNQRGQ